MNILLYLMIAFSFQSKPKEAVEKQHQYVLQKNIPGKQFTFGSIKKEGSELHLTYLGNVVTAKKKHYK